MSALQVVERRVEVPQGVEVKVNGGVVEVKGPLGTLREDLTHVPVDIALDQGGILVRAFWPRKKVAALVGTAASHVRNMIIGVTKGFTYKLKIVYAHFPINVKVDRERRIVLIENFLGERTPRIARIKGDVEVEAKGDEIHVRGLSLRDVSQTAANIEAATKVKKKDHRVFLDGVYVYVKEKAS
ncbi:MAG: 50S ribosomal protein L6 [Candidatus Bathyarchaeia archaeon]